MWSGEDSARGAALTDCGGYHQYQGDPLGHHSAGSQQAEEDEGGGQDVSEDQLEGNVQSVGGGVGGVDAHRRGPGHHGAADGELGQGGEEREKEEGEEEEATLLQPGQHARGSLDQQQADQADYQVVGEALTGFISI